MKKNFLLTVIAITMALSLTACGEKNDDTSKKVELKDGTYTVETKADDKGNTAKLLLEIKDEKIEKVNYNELKKDGSLKREDAEYNKMMEEKSGSSPEKFEPEFEKQILEAQSAEIDGVSGATSSSNKAKEMVSKALENAKEGKTEISTIETSK